MSLPHFLGKGEIPRKMEEAGGGLSTNIEPSHQKGKLGDGEDNITGQAEIASDKADSGLGSFSIIKALATAVLETGSAKSVRVQDGKRCSRLSRT